MIRRPPRSTLFPTRRSSDLPPRDALIADATLPALAGRAFGLQRGMDHAGAVLGPLAAWYLLASGDRKSTRLNSSHGYISYAVFCLKKKREQSTPRTRHTAAMS